MSVGLPPQSPEAMVWPLSSTRFNAGSVPLMLTFSPSPNWRSTLMPGRCESDSAALMSGNLPMSSALMASTIELAERLTAWLFSSEAR
nr:hypothetical protein [Xanthomonas campestris]